MKVKNDGSNNFGDLPDAVAYYEDLPKNKAPTGVLKRRRTTRKSDSNDWHSRTISTPGRPRIKQMVTIIALVLKLLKRLWR